MDQWESKEHNGTRAVMLDKADRDVWLLSIFDVQHGTDLVTGLDAEDLHDLAVFALQQHNIHAAKRP